MVRMGYIIEGCTMFRISRWYVWSIVLISLVIMQAFGVPDAPHDKSKCRDRCDLPENQRTVVYKKRPERPEDVPYHTLAGPFIFGRTGPDPLLCLLFRKKGVAQPKEKLEKS